MQWPGASTAETVHLPALLVHRNRQTARIATVLPRGIVARVHTRLHLYSAAVVEQGGGEAPTVPSRAPQRLAYF